MLVIREPLPSIVGWVRLPVLEHVLKHMPEYVLKHVPKHVLKHMPDKKVIEQVFRHVSKGMLKRMTHAVLMT